MGWLGRKKERTGKKKTIYLSHLWNETVIDYSERTGLSQSDTIEQLMLLGDREFRKKYKLGGEADESEAQKEKAKDREEAIKLQREKREREFQKLREDYWKKVLHDVDNSERYGWTRRE